MTKLGYVLGVMLLQQQRHGQSFQLIDKLGDQKGIDENENDVAPFSRDDPFLFMDDLSSFMKYMLHVPQYTGDVVVDDENHFQVFLDLPEEISMEDVHIEVEDGGTRLVIHGETTRHSSASNGDGDEAEEKRAAFGFRWSAKSTKTTSFAESFSIDSSVRVDQMVATFQDGRLLVFAPKGEQQSNGEKTANRVIPIQDLNAIGAGTDESSKESKPEDVNNNEGPHFLHRNHLPFVQQGAVTNEDSNKDELKVEEESGLPLIEDKNSESGDFVGGSSL